MSATDLQQRVEDIHAKQPPAAGPDIGEIAERAERAVREALRIPAFDAARAAAREAGLANARRDLQAAPGRLAAAQETYRTAQTAERSAKDGYDAALVDAEWDLDGRFVTEGSKTYLVLEAPPGEALAEPRKQMTAAERSAWKKAEATKQPAVQEALKALHAVEAERQAAADAVSLEERRFTACRLELEASIAQLSALTTALGRTA